MCFVLAVCCGGGELACLRGPGLAVDSSLRTVDDVDGATGMNSVLAAGTSGAATISVFASPAAAAELAASVFSRAVVLVPELVREPSASAPTKPTISATPPAIQPAFTRGVKLGAAAVVAESSVTAVGGDERGVVPLPSRIVGSCIETRPPPSRLGADEVW